MTALTAAHGAPTAVVGVGATGALGEVVSVNVGEPRTVTWHGGEIRTGIFKRPVPGPVGVGRRNLHGDGQADLVDHGDEQACAHDQTGGDARDQRARYAGRRDDADRERQDGQACLEGGVTQAALLSTRRTLVRAPSARGR